MRPIVRSLILLGCVTVAALPLGAQRIKLPLSLSELQQRVRADSNDPAAYYNVALAYWNEKRYDDAEQSLRTAISLEPRFAPAHLALAYLPYARRPKIWNEIWRNNVPGDMVPVLEQSDREYRHAFLIDPLVDLRIMAAVTPGSPDFLTVQDYLGEAYALFFQGFTDCEEGRYEDCHGHFVRLVREINGERFPERIPNSVLWYKGIAAAHIGKYDIAESHFRLLISRDIDFQKELEKKGDFSRVPVATNQYRYTLATILQAAGKEVEAVTLFREVLDQDIGVYMAHVRLASIYEGRKDYETALSERTQAVNANPDDPSLLLDLGITLGKAGKMPEAETNLQSAATANPRDARALFWLGLAQMEQGKRPEAKDTFTRFLSIAPSRYDRQIATAKDRLAQLQ